MSKPKVVVSRKPPASLSKLQEHCEVSVWEEDRPMPRELLLEQIGEAEGLFTMVPDRIDQALLDAAPRLKAIATMAVGTDNIDLEACTRRGIPVGYTRDQVTEATADLAFSLVLAVSRRLVEASAYVQDGRWKAWSPSLMIANDVFGKTLGVFGMGRIGRAVGRRARGFLMPVIYHNRRPSPQAEEEGAQYRSFDDLLTESDVLVITAPLTPETRHKFGTEALARMKSSAFLVNAGRGPLVDPAALHQALTQGKIKGAALDVTEPEPIPADDPLLSDPNCLIVPHIGTSTWETRKLMSDATVDNLLHGLAGRPMIHCANPDAQRAAG